MSSVTIGIRPLCPLSPLRVSLVHDLSSLCLSIYMYLVSSINLDLPRYAHSTALWLLVLPGGTTNPSVTWDPSILRVVTWKPASRARAQVVRQKLFFAWRLRPKIVREIRHFIISCLNPHNPTAPQPSQIYQDWFSSLRTALRCTDGTDATPISRPSNASSPLAWRAK